MGLQCIQHRVSRRNFRSTRFQQSSCVSKHSTGRTREGCEDTTLRRVDRGAQGPFYDLSSVFEEQLCPPESERDREHVVHSIYQGEDVEDLE